MLTPVTVQNKIVYREDAVRQGRRRPGDVLDHPAHDGRFARLALSGRRRSVAGRASNGWCRTPPPTRWKSRTPAGGGARASSTATSARCSSRKASRSGRYEYLYLVKAMSSGTFRAAPAQISPMYVPGVFRLVRTDDADRDARRRREPPVIRTLAVVSADAARGRGGELARRTGASCPRPGIHGLDCSGSRRCWWRWPSIIVAVISINVGAAAVGRGRAGASTVSPRTRLQVPLARRATPASRSCRGAVRGIAGLRSRPRGTRRRPSGGRPSTAGWNGWNGPQRRDQCLVHRHRWAGLTSDGCAHDRAGWIARVGADRGRRAPRRGLAWWNAALRGQWWPSRAVVRQAVSLQGAFGAGDSGGRPARSGCRGPTWCPWRPRGLPRRRHRRDSPSSRSSWASPPC